MQTLVIEGGRKLSGELRLQGAKNSALPLLSAAILSEGESVFTDCPRLTDVYAACRILTGLGCRCTVEGNTVTVKTSDLSGLEIPGELMREMRSSIIFLGAVLGRTGRCRLSFPGGCELGPRPIDLHLSALRKMGASITEEYGVLNCTAGKGLSGAKIILPFPSVGATENILLAAALAKGQTELKNAAREPEIVDLANYLNKCGGKIYGAGEGTIIIDGVSRLDGCEYAVMPDRIAAVTYLGAAAVTGGDLRLTNARAEDVESVIPVFEQMGCQLYAYNDSIYIRGKSRLNSVKNIRTMPYPGFPTDAQAIIMACLCKADGTSVFEENIFENRYKHVGELAKMGADIKIIGKAAVVGGVERLYGASVSATDLRGGAALVLAGLSAEGVTSVDAIKHIDRGYESIEERLSLLGAEIRRT